MEDKLFDALKDELHSRKRKIKRAFISKLARKMSNVQEFKASKGWYARFNERTKFEEY